VSWLNLTLCSNNVSLQVGLTNQPDYSRFARRPGDQVFGQYFAIIFAGTIFPLFGCLTASATQAYLGEAVWNPRTFLCGSASVLSY
jgi:cytosine/uracil/thiamine/allantoin permease